MNHLFYSKISHALILSVFATGALADNNSIFITQSGPVVGDNGNTIFIDQSLASASSFGTEQNPAVQSGQNNSAEVTIESAGGAVDLFTQGLLNLGESDNQAVINIGPGGVDALAGLAQLGSGNVAAITLDGLNSSGTVAQIGDLNDATLSVTGNGASGSITQNGDSNTNALTVNGATVDLIVNGSGIAGNFGPSVASNGGTVTITQTRANTTFLGN